MPSFTVRVELHGVSDYDPLHTEMRKRKFKTTIAAADGTEYHLPTAEYNLPDGIATTKDAVRDLAKAAVVAALATENQQIKNKNKPPTVLVTKSTGRAWSGLKQV